MPDGRKDGDDFASLVDGAKPLAGRRRLAHATRKPRPAARDPQPGFVFPKPDAPLLAHAPDCDAKRFDALRRGRIAPDDSIDLHGMRKAEAHAELLAALRRAWDEGDDCIRVVHGKGLSSDRTPVLRQALPGWLTSAPLAAQILAFAPAPAGQGGSGATLVLLRPE